jgi:hypothetical protein
MYTANTSLLGLFKTALSANKQNCTILTKSVELKNLHYFQSKFNCKNIYFAPQNPLKYAIWKFKIVKFSGEGPVALSPDPSPIGEGIPYSPNPTPLGAFRASIFAPSAHTPTST